MRAKDLLGMAVFMAFAMLPTSFAQECDDDADCTEPFCCMDTGTCSTTAKAAVLLGEIAEDSCECDSLFLNAETGVCDFTRCDDDDDCTEPFCCMDNGACSTREKDSVEIIVEADDACECSSGLISDILGICLSNGKCDADDDCSSSSCCMSKGQCSSRVPRSAGVGGKAEDSCECLSGLLGPNGQCVDIPLCGGVVCAPFKCCRSDFTCSSVDAFSLPYGAPASDWCECETSFLHSTGICGCDRNSDCDPYCCVKDTNLCSVNRHRSVLGGNNVNDRCECTINSATTIGHASKTCRCNVDTDCDPHYPGVPDVPIGPDLCCTKRGNGRNHICVPTKQYGGTRVEDECQCRSGKMTIRDVCTCTHNDHCVSKCCDTTRSECTPANQVATGGEANVECQCVNESLFDPASGLCGCTADADCSTICCNTETSKCTPEKEFDAEESADVECQCVNRKLNPAPGVCGCTVNADCSSDCCNTETYKCTPEKVINAGDAADVECQCVNMILAPAPGVCGCKTNEECASNCCNTETSKCTPEMEIEAGDQADVKCQCVSGVLDPAPGVCGCEEDEHCEEPFCCMENKKCSTQEKKSVAAGEAADDKCICETCVIDGEGICEMCADDEDCGDPFCCMENGKCSTIAKKSVEAGAAADDKCLCVNCAISDGTCDCVSDDECQGENEICCPENDKCGERGERFPSACGDPHMTGFHGQKFDFTGVDGGWYVLISDSPSMHLNMRVSAPIPSLPEITYITGLSLLTTDADGVDHTVVISVKDPHNMDSACPDGIYPCLADGSLSVVADGNEVLVAPGAVTLGPDVQVTAVNIPGECRSFGFETYWEKKQLEYAQSGRRLLSETLSIGEWILADPTATNMAECTTYVARAMSEEGAIFTHQSEHASFQIVTPTGTIRLSHGRLHQLPMRDPTDQFDLPDHLTWQMNMAIEHADISHDAQGIIGETFVPTFDDSGNIIMHGMECIRGTEADYAVVGPLGVTFAQGEHNF